MAKKVIDYKKATKEQLIKMGLSPTSRQYIPSHITRVTKSTKHISRRQAEKIESVKATIKAPSISQIAGATARREKSEIRKIIRKNIADATGVKPSRINMSEFGEDVDAIYKLKKLLINHPEKRTRQNMQEYFDFFPSEQWKDLRDELYPKNSVFSGRD